MKSYKKKLNPKAKKAITAFLVLLLMAGLYGAVIAVCNQYLREYNMMTKSSKYILGIFMFAGFYLIYKWFSKRIDTISNDSD